MLRWAYTRPFLHQLQTTNTPHRTGRRELVQVWRPGDLDKLASPCAVRRIGRLQLVQHSFRSTRT
ncbi:hypothetical protein PF003_g16212 [Phytophthora fragariae]|nr:hypothetical protein PF003_g16212 [Phytophthora fragariae]